MTPASFQEQLERVLINLNTGRYLGYGGTEYAGSLITQLFIDSLPKRVADNIGSSSSDFEHGFRKGKNNTIDTITAVIKGETAT